MQKFLRLLLGAPNDDDPPIGHHFEKFISALGALVAIFCVAAINAIAIPDLGAPLIIASMGASAVLLFATPHSPFTQPWPVLGGQLVSGMIGVSCATYISDIRLAAALAVGLSLFAMYYLRCLHPPGGATALSAVIGGVTVHQLGFQYVAAPVMLDALVIIFVAVLFNYLFPWRRYPLWLNAPPAAQGPAPAGEPAPLHIAKEDIHYALQHMESFVDVSELDLAEIYRLATQHAEAARMRPEQILLGHCYSNGRPGGDRSVRKIIDESGVATTPEKDKVIYRILAGANLRATGTCTRAEFAHWAKHEVVETNGEWKRVS